jgi:glycosyltransferase involved in cell wall biosynthesis
MNISILHINIAFANPLYNELYSRFANTGIKQFIYYPRRKGNKKIDFSKYKYQGYAPLVHKKWHRFAYPVKIKAYLKQLEHYFSQEEKNFNEFNLIHAHTLFADGAVAYKLKQKYNIKYIAAIRFADEEYLQKMPFLKKYGKKLIENAEKLICISPHLKQKFLKFYGNDITGLENKIEIIPNGIDDKFFKTNLLPKNFKEQGKAKLLYVGNFLKLKNIPYLVNFAKKYKYQLTIIGGGGNGQNQAIEIINKAKHVNNLGRITNKEELKKHYRQHDIFIMISETETFGQVYVEAMSMGTPIIYSQNTGFDGFFREGTVGYAVNPDNFEDIEEKVNRIMNNYKNISQNCLEKAKQFHWDKITNKYLTLYQEINNK